MAKSFLSIILERFVVLPPFVIKLKGKPLSWQATIEQSEKAVIKRLLVGIKGRKIRGKMR
jgi:hypothetical protein